MSTPSWYLDIEADEAELDRRIREQSSPRKPCATCGLSHRSVCPSGPGVAEILSAPVPVNYDPPCEGDE